MTETPLTTCPDCSGTVKKLVSMSSFQLKGGGWYADGYNSKSSDGAGSSASDKSTASPAEKSTSSTSASTSDTKSKDACPVTS